ALSDVLEDASNELGTLARLTLQRRCSALRCASRARCNKAVCRVAGLFSVSASPSITPHPSNQKLKSARQ
ncbi:hypothetical protein, partial [Pseudomonas sp. P5_A2_2]